ncbi:MAG: alpha/beta hydrolase [Ruminococcaceae bacterium]|nr:alpha/beta hydrolase [Oscillospiraceae bacterium]
MINKFMKKTGEKAYLKDLERIDLSKSDGGIKVLKDISYIDDNSAEHKLDIHYKSNSGLKPVLVNIHGGGFIAGYKESDSLFADYLARRGFVVFNLNYRLAYPTFNVFDQIEDISDAVKWIISNAEKYEGDINKMYIAGHSAGGVLAVAESLLCDDERMRADYNIEDRDYKYNGIILDCGAMHFYKSSLAYWGMRNMIFPKGYKKTDKYKYLIFDKNNKLSVLPKTVILTNEKDELRKMSYHFKRVLDYNNVDNKLFDIGSDGHIGIIFKPYTVENQKILDNITEYFELRGNKRRVLLNGG